MNALYSIWLPNVIAQIHIATSGIYTLLIDGKKDDEDSDSAFHSRYLRSPDRNDPND